MTGTVESIWITDEGSAPMESVDAIEAVEGGLAGDRYCRGTGYYSGFDECEVTLIATEAIETIRDETDIDLGDGRHRRNIVTSGVDLDALLDAEFQVGEATLAGTRPRPPCAHVEDVADEDGVARALRGERGGICARVVDPGAVAVGDSIEVGESLTTDPDELAAAIEDRQ